MIFELSSTDRPPSWLKYPTQTFILETGGIYSSVYRMNEKLTLPDNGNCSSFYTKIFQRNHSFWSQLISNEKFLTVSDLTVAHVVCRVAVNLLVFFSLLFTNSLNRNTTPIASATKWSRFQFESNHSAVIAECTDRRRATWTARNCWWMIGDGKPQEFEKTILIWMASKSS